MCAGVLDFGSEVWSKNVGGLLLVIKTLVGRDQDVNGALSEVRKRSSRGEEDKMSFTASVNSPSLPYPSQIPLLSLNHSL